MLHSFRRSLNTSLGSRCFSLASYPRRGKKTERTPEKQRNVPEVCELESEEVDRGAERAGGVSEAWLLFPAYAAIFMGVASGCFAIQDIAAWGSMKILLPFLLGVVGLLSFGSRCATKGWKTLCQIGRWLFAAALFALLVSVWLNNILTLDNDSEINILVANVVGFVSVLAFLFVGAQVGGRIVSLSAPLVPCVSLYGLLCSIAVNTQVQFCFLIFLLSSLYLLTYDRYLRRVCPELSRGVPALTPLVPWPSRGMVRAWTFQSFVISFVWFGVFSLGGLCLYLPVRAVLPNVMGQQISKVRSAAQGLTLDICKGGNSMELHGGSYALSDREIMKITVTQGRISGLWRGRVFSQYSRSRWEEEPLAMMSARPEFFRSIRKSPSSSRAPLHLLHSANQQLLKTPDYSPGTPSLTSAALQMQASEAGLNKPRLSPQQGRVREVLEWVQSSESVAGTLYSSGFPVGWMGRSITGNDESNEGLTSGYVIRSLVIEPRRRTLRLAPGIESMSLRELSHSPFAPWLQLPQGANERLLLSAVAQQIYLGNPGLSPTSTPQQKLEAISGYLNENCLYSLSSPQVPRTRDATLFFLTESRQGACDMFASSTALLLREMKVPARVVSGYLQSDDLPIRDEGGRETYIVKERDAHAWIEYFVPNYGWLPFDPTRNTRTAAETSPFQISQWLDLPTFDISTPILFLPFLGFALTAMTLMYNGRAKTPTDAIPDDNRVRVSIERHYENCVRDLKRQVPHQAHLTPGEFENRVHRAPIPSAAKGEFAALTHLYNAAKYGATPEASLDEIEACARRFRAALRQK